MVNMGVAMVTYSITMHPYHPNNLTSDTQNLFDIHEIGYYGSTAMCTQNFFNNNKSYRIYKLLYLISLSVFLIIITVTYIEILRQHVLSKRRIAALNQAPPNGQGDNDSSEMLVKIFLMIGSQLVTWVSLISTMIYFTVTDKSPPDYIYEMFALVVIPVNALMNPIFYSGIYKIIKNKLFYYWRKFVGLVNPL